MIKFFKRMLKKYEHDPSAYSDIINVYLVYMGVRSACLIGARNADAIYDSVPKSAKMIIYKGLYPGFTKTGFDYPLICLKGSWTSNIIENMQESEFTENILGLCLGYNCYSQDWGNTKINRYSIEYTLDEPYTYIYSEVCSKSIDAKIRIKFKAIEMTEALKLINKDFRVSCSINRLKPMAR